MLRTIALLALILTGCFEDGVEGPGPAPEVAGEYTIVSYVRGHGCGDSGEASDEYKTMTVRQQEVEGRSELEVVACEGAEGCDSVYSLGRALPYAGDDRWGSTSSSASTATATTCHLQRVSTSVELLADGTLRIEVRRQERTVPYKLVFDPCEIEKLPDELECAYHEIVVAARR